MGVPDICTSSRGMIGGSVIFDPSFVHTPSVALEASVSLVELLNLSFSLLCKMDLLQRWPFGITIRGQLEILFVKGRFSTYAKAVFELCVWRCPDVFTYCTSCCAVVAAALARRPKCWVVAAGALPLYPEYGGAEIGIPPRLSRY